MNRTVPLILAVALFMENMDSTVIATSLPAIAHDIGTSPIALKLALTAYLVSLAIFIPISGWMADRYGAKNIFRAAIGVFIVGSVACAISGSLAEFVGARFLQGMGGAMMTPIARLVLVRATPRSELVGAMSWLVVPALVGPLVGPPVGGFITTYFTWHWIFIINVPIGIVGMVLATIYLPRIDAPQPRKLDVTGAILSGIGASGIVFGLSVVSLPALPPIVGIVTVAVGIVAAVAYFFHARRVEHPLLSLDLFRKQTFAASVLGGGLFRLGIGAVPFLLPLMFQVGFGLTPFESGMLTFVSAIGALGMKFATTRLFRAFGFRRSLIAGSLVAAVTVAINGAFTPDTPHLVIMGLLLVGGFIRSMFFTGINVLAYAEVSEEDTSRATPIVTVAQQISIALGVALAGGILEVTTQFHGGGLGLTDFHIAFFIIGGVCAFSALWYVRLPADAGSAISGHASQKRQVEAAQPNQPTT